MKQPFFVAELSINHLGMVKIAKMMIEAAQQAGAHAVKLKLKNVKKYYKKEKANWRNLDFLEYRTSLELSHDDFVDISSYCQKKDIPWFCTVHDMESLDFIRSLNPLFYKVASMDSSKMDFVESVLSACRDDGKKLVISIGGKSDEETKNIIERLKNSGIEAYVLHAISIYPTPEGQSNIKYIVKLIRDYRDDQISIGYSGHEIGYAPSVMAYIYGAEMIERHFTLSKDFKIHHIQSALTPHEFKQMTSLILGIGKEIKQPMSAMSLEELRFLQDEYYA